MPAEDPVKRLAYRLDVVRDESRRLLPMALLWPPGIAVLIGLFVPVFQASEALLEDSGEEALPGTTIFGIVGNPAEQQGAGLMQALALTAALLSLVLIIALISTGLSGDDQYRRRATIAAEVAAIALALMLVLLATFVASPEGGFLGGLGYTMGARLLPALAVIVWSAIAAHRVRGID